MAVRREVVGSGKLPVAQGELARPMSLGEVARALGWGDDEVARRKLSRFILAREKKIGCEIMIRLGGSRHPKYRVTIPALEHYCPELFNRRELIAHALGHKVDRRFEAVTENVSEMRSLLFSLDERLLRVEAFIARLQTRGLFSGPTPSSSITPGTRMRDAQRRVGRDEEDDGFDE